MVEAGIDCQSNYHECPKLRSQRALSSKFESIFKGTFRGKLSILWTRNRAYSKFNAKISRNLWCTSEENGKSTSPAWRHVHLGGHYKPHLVPPCHLVAVYNNHPHCHFVNSSQISIKTPCAILSSPVHWPTCFWKLPSPLKQVGRGTLRHLVTISKKIKLTLFHLVSICLSTSQVSPCALPQPAP